jgi:hypothetical protein
VYLTEQVTIATLSLFSFERTQANGFPFHDGGLAVRVG